MSVIRSLRRLTAIWVAGDYASARVSWLGLICSTRATRFERASMSAGRLVCPAASSRSKFGNLSTCVCIPRSSLVFQPVRAASCSFQWPTS